MIGGGFIGLECAENFRHAGLDVTLIQLLDHVIIGDRCYSSLRERGILSDKG